MSLSTLTLLILLVSILSQSTLHSMAGGAAVSLNYEEVLNIPLADPPPSVPLPTNNGSLNATGPKISNLPTPIPQLLTTTTPVNNTISIPHPHPTFPPVHGPSPEVVKKLAELQAKSDSQQLTIARMNATMLSRILTLEHLEQQHHNVLAGRVTAAEKSVKDLKTSIAAEMATLDTSMNSKVSDLKGSLHGEMEVLSATVDGTKSAVRTLETGKVQRLLNNNEIWKKNFKVINNTLHRLGKSVRNG